MITSSPPPVRLLRFLGKVQSTTVLLLGGAVVMTYYGVNFILDAGVHAYVFSKRGYIFMP